MAAKVDEKIRGEILKRMTANPALGIPMHEDLKVFAAFVLDPDVKKAYVIGWTDGFAAAHAITPDPEADATAETDAPAHVDHPVLSENKKDAERAYG